MDNTVINFSRSDIETIDAALLDYVEGLNIFCNTINGWNKVPVIWSSAERAFQIKNNKEIRDKSGALIPPIISIERTSTAKDPARKGSYHTSLSPNYDRRIIAKQLKQDVTSKFANADSLKTSGQINFITSKKNQKQVYEFYSAPVPIYITVDYKIHVLTNYQGQMNEVLQPFMTKTAQNYFIISKDDHRYECFIDQNFEQESIGSLSEEERKYKSTITIKVLGYLLGQGVNDENSSFDKLENAVEIKLPKENIVLMQEEGAKKETNIFPNGAKQVTSGVALKKTFTIGDGINSVYIVTHNLKTRDMYVSVRSNSAEDDYEKVEVAISFYDLNNISIDMGDIITLDSYVVTIIG